MFNEINRISIMLIKHINFSWIQTNVLFTNMYKFMNEEVKYFAPSYLYIITQTLTPHLWFQSSCHYEKLCALKNHATLQLKVKKKLIYKYSATILEYNNYCATIIWKYMVLINKLSCLKINSYYNCKWVENGFFIW